jgi:hypothetical protein
MSTDEVDMLWQSITIIEAQEQLKAFGVADWPNIKKSERTKIHKNLFNLAYPSELKEKNLISLDELKKVMGQ